MLPPSTATFTEVETFVRGGRPTCENGGSTSFTRTMQRAVRRLQVDLVYEGHCPNIERARAMIRAALLEVGVAMTWSEWNRNDGGCVCGAPLAVVIAQAMREARAERPHGADPSAAPAKRAPYPA